MSKEQWGHGWHHGRAYGYDEGYRDGMNDDSIGKMMSGAIGAGLGMFAAGFVGVALETLGDLLESRNRGDNYYPCARSFYDDDDDDDW